MVNMTEEFENDTYDYLEYGDFEDNDNSGYVQREALHLVAVAIYSLSFVLGVVGNGAVIWVTACKSKRTVNSVWLLNLAVADLVFVLFLPFSIDYVLRDFHWGSGLVMCKLNSFVSVMNMYASVLFLTVISVDRYVSLVHLGWCQRWRSVPRAWLLCLGVWVAAIILSIPVLVFRDIVELKWKGKIVCFNHFHETDADLGARRHMVMVCLRITVGFLLPFSAITVCGILLAIRTHRLPATRTSSSFYRMISAVILAFFLCWAPLHVFSVMELSIYTVHRLHHVLKVGFPLATSLAFFNSCINPVLYVLINKKVRALMKHSCLDFAKNSFRELSQSISAADSVGTSSVGVEPIEMDAVK